MARQYNNISGLDAAVSGFMEGRKFNQDEAYRQAIKDMNERQAVGRLSEFAYNQGKGQITPELDERGYATGRILDNQENIDRDNPILNKIFPEIFKETINKGMAARPDPAVALERNASTERARLQALEDAKRLGMPTEQFETPSSPGAPAMPPPPPQPQIGASQPLAQALSPQPLLKSKESLKQDLQFTGKPGNVSDQTARGSEIRKEDLREPQLVGSEGGIDRYLQYANKAAVNQRKDAAVNLLEPFTEDKMLPAVPEEVANYNPSAMLRAGLIDRLSSSTAKESDPIIPYSSLTPSQRSILGIPENIEGGQRASILKEWIQLASKSAGNSGKDINPITIKAVKKIEQGKKTFAEAAQELADEQMFNPTKEQVIVLQAAESRYNQKKAREASFGLAKGKDERDQLKLSPKNEDKINNLETLRNNLANAKELVASGKVKPRGALDAARRFNAYGGLPLEIFNKSLEAAGIKPISNDEAQFLKLTENTNLNKLVEVAGTTFTARFGSLIQGIGVDITDPERFAQNVDQMISEIDRSKDAIINTSQANKSGKIREEVPPSGAKKESTKVSTPTVSKKDAEEAKSNARAAFDALNKSGDAPEVKAQKTIKILKWYKNKTGQYFFGTPRGED
jgi:hypothetical protein